MPGPADAVRIGTALFAGLMIACGAGTRVRTLSCFAYRIMVEVHGHKMIVAEDPRPSIDA